jgi:hypothetical protein
VLTLVLAAAWVLPQSVSRVQADNAPDWVRAVAQEKLPEYPKDTVAVVLLDDLWCFILTTRRSFLF